MTGAIVRVYHGEWTGIQRRFVSDFRKGPTKGPGTGGIQPVKWYSRVPYLPWAALVAGFSNISDRWIEGGNLRRLAKTVEYSTFNRADQKGHNKAAYSEHNGTQALR